MTDTASRVHYYHADAYAFSGSLQNPFEKIIPVQAPLTLPVTGGYAAARVENFRFEEIVSFKSAYTQVAGAPSKKPNKNGAADTLATAAIEGLNVRDILTVDRVVAQISTEHPAAGGPPKVSFLGTRFENLRINGRLISPDPDLELCAQEEGRPAKSCINNPAFLEKIGKRYDENNPSVLCSLVKEVAGKPGNVIHLPSFGKIYLAELIVDHNSYQLTMLRLELGCAIQGPMGGPGIKVNGGGK